MVAHQSRRLASVPGQSNGRPAQNGRDGQKWEVELSRSRRAPGDRMLSMSEPLVVVEAEARKAEGREREREARGTS